MAVDISKQLDRAKRYLEKNKVDDAIEAYQEILGEAPGHAESLQALGDLYTRQGQLDRAATQYGLLFDRFCDLVVRPVSWSRRLLLFPANLSIRPKRAR